jgi:hypothetical protein
VALHLRVDRPSVTPDTYIRGTDPDGSQEHAKRRLTMAADGPQIVINGWIGRATAIAKIANHLTVSTLLLGILIFVAMIYIGKVDVPIYAKLDKMAEAEATMTVRMGQLELNVKANREELIGIRQILTTFWRIECENAAKGEQQLRNCQNIR